MNQAFLQMSADDLTEIQILTIDLNMSHPSFLSLAPAVPTFKQAPPLASYLSPTSTDSHGKCDPYATAVVLSSAFLSSWFHLLRAMSVQFLLC